MEPGCLGELGGLGELDCHPYDNWILISVELFQRWDPKTYRKITTWLVLASGKLLTYHYFKCQFQYVIETRQAGTLPGILRITHDLGGLDSRIRNLNRHVVVDALVGGI
jgi:hypothetical protein